MIELTQEQIQAISQTSSAPARLVNPQTNETFVLLRADEYEHLKEQEYDDSPWTREELQAAAWEIAEQSEWDEYDDSELP